MRNKIEPDWSKHQLTIKRDTNSVMYSLKIDNQQMYSVNLIIAYGACVVNGDYGNWTFSRVFDPSNNLEAVYDSYFAEKVRISSTQTTHDYDPEMTKEEIGNRINEVLADEGILIPDENDDLPPYSKPTGEQVAKLSQSGKEKVAWLIDCLAYAEESEHEYLSQAHDGCPRWLDPSDAIIVCRSIKPWLSIVHSAFTEMQKRIAQMKKEGTYVNQ